MYHQSAITPASTRNSNQPQNQGQSKWQISHLIINVDAQTEKKANANIKNYNNSASDYAYTWWC